MYYSDRLGVYFASIHTAVLLYVASLLTETDGPWSESHNTFVRFFFILHSGKRNSTVISLVCKLHENRRASKGELEQSPITLLDTNAHTKNTRTRKRNNASVFLTKFVGARKRKKTNIYIYTSEYTANYSQGQHEKKRVSCQDTCPRIPTQKTSLHAHDTSKPAPRQSADAPGPCLSEATLARGICP